MPLTTEQVKEFAASLDANGDGKVRVEHTPSPNSEQLTELLTIFCTIQITVEDFWLLFLARSPHSTVEEMEADLDAHEADVDAGLPPFREKMLANLA